MDFDRFYQTLLSYPTLQSVFSVYDVLVGFCLPVVLIAPIIWVYRRTHKGVTYNQMFTHTMFVMAVTVSIIMMIIGSNIARAFSLVGALSIIRFRTAVKDSRDTGYIFAAMAVGMACGTGMYMVAAVFSLLFCALMFALAYFRVGEKILVDKLLKVYADSAQAESGVAQLLSTQTSSAALIHSETDPNGQGMLLTYVISAPSEQTHTDLLEKVRGVKGVTKTSIFYNDQRIEI